jgi:acyl-CoA synthetase (AMP-forming)/AMP-acid ligase II
VKGLPLPAARFATVNEVLAAAVGHPSGLTFVDLREREVRLDWREVYARAGRVATGLAGLGVRPGDRVAIVLATSPDFVSAFFGVLLAAAVPVPIYPPARLGRLAEYAVATARLLTASGAALVLTDARIGALLGEPVASARPALGCRTVESLRRSAGGRALPAPGPDDLALIQFSSGSTVEPKPVALTHRALVNQFAMLDAVLPHAAGGDRGASWLPLYHDMGLIGGPLLAAYVPGPLALIPPEHFLVRPALWLRAVSRHRATVSPAPPFALGLCARRVSEADLEGVDLGSLELLACGAEPVSLATVERFVERFAPHGLDRAAVRPVYGLSEAALAVSFSPPGRAAQALRVDADRLARDGEVAPGRRAVVSVGGPIPGVEVEVRTADGVAAERRVGRVWVRSASLMSGYLGRPEATAAALVDGWLDTGDLGFVSGGELYVSGRAKDVVIIRGANHDPQEFEDCLGGVSGVRPGCAVAVGFAPEEGDSEALLILAERDAGQPEEPEPALAARVSAAVLAGTGIAPHTVVLLPPGTLPRTSSGKLRRGEALRLYLVGALRPPQGANPVRLAGALVRSARGHLLARPGARREER